MGKIWLGIGLVFFFTACATDTKSSSGTDSTATAMEAEKVEAIPTKSVAKKTADIVVCTVDKDERSIEVKSVGKGCEVFYTKYGETKSIAESNWGLAHCKKIQEKIKNTLVSAGFVCEE